MMMGGDAMHPIISLYNRPRIYNLGSRSKS